MEYGEGIFETLKREVKEEIGVDLEFQTKPRLLSVNDYLHPNDKIHRLLVHFVYEIIEPIVKKPNEGEPYIETIWLTKQEVLELPVNPKYKKMLLGAFEK